MHRWACAPGPPLPSKAVCPVTCSLGRLLGNQMSSRSGRSDAASHLPPPTQWPHRLLQLQTPQVLVRIRGLATACPTVYRHQERRAREGASLQETKSVAAAAAAAANRGGQWGPCTWNSIRTVAQASLLERQEWARWWGLGPKPLKTSLSQPASQVAQTVCTVPPGHSHHPRLPCTEPLSLPPAFCVTPPPCVCPSIS